MNAFDVYKTFIAIKNYYKVERVTYDFKNHIGATKVTDKSFIKRKDKQNFYKLETHFSNIENLEYYLFCNIFWNDSITTYELLDFKNRMKCTNFTKEFISNPLYQFQNDINKLANFCEINNCRFADLCKLNGGMNPVLYQMMNSQDYIHIETVLFINKILHFLPIWINILMKDDFVFQSRYKRYEKFLSFVKFKINFDSKLQENFKNLTLTLL